MLRLIVSFFAFFTAVSPCVACSICGDALASRQTLRQYHAEAKVVIFGQLRNPTASAEGFGGTTEFHVTQTLKTEPGFAVPKVVMIPRYLPVIGNTPPDFLFFCTISDGKLNPFQGVPANAATVAYLSAMIKLDAKNQPLALKSTFQYLEDKEPAIAQDAFLEFARASDADLQNAAASFDRAKLRAWIADAKVPEERLGVYSLLLGLCGNAEDSAWLSQQLAIMPRPERYRNSLGGLLAGLAILDPARGWPAIQTVLAAKDGPIEEKLSAIGCLNYFHATRPRESQEQILKACRMLLADSDLADRAIDDLRRWACWDLTAEVLKCFDGPMPSPMLKRGIVHYALSCPDAESKAFLSKLRIADPKLVAKVEAALKR